MKLIEARTIILAPLLSLALSCGNDGYTDVTLEQGTENIETPFKDMGARHDLSIKVTTNPSTNLMKVEATVTGNPKMTVKVTDTGPGGTTTGYQETTASMSGFSPGDTVRVSVASPTHGGKPYTEELTLRNN